MRIFARQASGSRSHDVDAVAHDPVHIHALKIGDHCVPVPHALPAVGFEGSETVSAAQQVQLPSCTQCYKPHHSRFAIELAHAAIQSWMPSAPNTGHVADAQVSGGRSCRLLRTSLPLLAGLWTTSLHLT